MTSLVLTVIGPDRVGLVGTLSAIVAEHGANWVESSMASLSGTFAGILRVDVESSRAAALTAALRSMEGFDATVREADNAPEPSANVALEVVGTDHPGIVRAISATLAEFGVNVVEFESEQVAAPMSGEPLFKARARLNAPSALGVDALRRSLEELANDLMVEVTLIA